MTHDRTLEGQVQVVVNAMLDEKLIPLALNVGKITRDGNDYTIHFYDSLIRSAKLHLLKGQTLDEEIRSAVLAQLAKMSRPFKRNLPVHT